MDYWINRTAYGDKWMEYVRQWLIKKNQTCNGWGGAGMDLRKGLAAFEQGYIAKGWDPNEDEASWRIGARRRFKVLKKLLNVKPGDRVIIPRLSVDTPGEGSHFTICTVVKGYSFEPIPQLNDMGHHLTVEPESIFSYSYYENALTEQIAEKINARYPYGAAVSRIGDTNAYLRGVIEQLISLKKN